MKDSATPVRTPQPGAPLFSHSIKIVTGTVLLTSLVACATAPLEPAEPSVPAVPVSELAKANDNYAARNYPGAVREYEAIIKDDDASANNRRLAHLGKALVFLGPDKDWHSLENAKMSLGDAGRIAPDDNEEFAIETDMLMDSVTTLIGAESELRELQAKSGSSGAEVARLKKERDALAAERDALLEEQQGLNAALEKLKNLTLGN